MSKSNPQLFVVKSFVNQRVALAAADSETTAAEIWRILACSEALLKEFGVDSEQVRLPASFGLRAARTVVKELEKRGVRLWIVASPNERHAAALAAGPGAPLVVRVPVLGRTGSKALTTLEPLQNSVVGRAAFATVAIGEAGAKNAALLAVAILAAAGDARLRAALHAYRRSQTEAVLAMRLPDDEKPT